MLCQPRDRDRDIPGLIPETGSRIFPGSGSKSRIFENNGKLLAFLTKNQISFKEQDNYAYKLQSIHKKVMNCRCFHHCESFEKIVKKFLFLFMFFSCYLFTFCMGKNPGYPDPDPGNRPGPGFWQSILRRAKKKLWLRGERVRYAELASLLT